MMMMNINNPKLLFSVHTAVRRTLSHAMAWDSVRTEVMNHQHMCHMITIILVLLELDSS